MLTSILFTALIIIPDDEKWKASEHLGKTPRQVVTLGYSKWYDLREKNRGELGFGEEIDEFALALRLDNHAILRTMSSKRRAWILKAEDLAHDFASCQNSIGPMLFDGTRWRTECYWNHLQADYAVRRWISQKPPRRTYPEDVDFVFKAIDQFIREWEPIEGKVFTKSEILKARAEIGKSHHALWKHVSTGTKVDKKVWSILFHDVLIYSM